MVAMSEVAIVRRGYEAMTILADGRVLAAPSFPAV